MTTKNDAGTTAPAEPTSETTDQPVGEEIMAPTMTQEPAPVRTVSQTRWMEFLQKHQQLPETVGEELPPEATDPNALPPEVQEIEANGYFKFALVGEVTDDAPNDWKIVQDMLDRGYVPVQRTNLPDRRIAHLFDGTGTIRIGPQVLFVTTTEIYKARRKREREHGTKGLKRSEEGRDELGQIPGLITGDAAEAFGAEGMEMEDQIGYDAPDLETEVPVRGTTITK